MDIGASGQLTACAFGSQSLGSHRLHGSWRPAPFMGQALWDCSVGARMQGNPCYRKVGDVQQRLHVIRQLPRLTVLNRLAITARERRAAGHLPHLPAPTAFAFGRTIPGTYPTDLTVPTRMTLTAQAAAAADVSATPDAAAAAAPSQIADTSSAPGTAMAAGLAPETPKGSPAAAEKDGQRRSASQGIAPAALKPDATIAPQSARALSSLEGSAWKLPPPAVCPCMSAGKFDGRDMMPTTTMSPRVCSLRPGQVPISFE